MALLECWPRATQLLLYIENTNKALNMIQCLSSLHKKYCRGLSFWITAEFIRTPHRHSTGQFDCIGENSVLGSLGFQNE